MKALAFLPLALVGISGAQTLPRLDPALPVDIRVKTIDWHPFGEALLYSREEETGIGIGIYRVGDHEGKVVLRLAKGDQWSSEWFQGSNSALVTVNRKVQTVQGEANEADVYLVDANQKSAYEVFSRAVLAPDKISIETELSPVLTHAICTVHEGKKSYTTVLPINGGRLVTSPDIDQALAQGLSGPSWSRDGTALYGKGLGSGVMTFRLSGQSGQGTLQSDGKSGSFVLQLSAEGDLSKQLGSAIQGLILKMQPPSPPAGTPVLEVVPSNGVLRQVRSPGPWVEKPEEETNLQQADNRSWIDYKRMRGSSHSLWLVLVKPGPNQITGDGNGSVIVDNGTIRVTGSGNGSVTTDVVRDDAAGVLVAANADSAELAPRAIAIAYITDGALFVRKIVKQR
ncbi:MAG: hypothetical protein ACHQ50_16375 [Fimbriimonadales bacterium]